MNRSGQGTLGLVLAAAGVCLALVVGASQMGSGSRVTLDRVTASTRALSAALSAIDEVCDAPAHRQALIDRMVQDLPASNAFGPIAPDRRIHWFLSSLDPHGVVDLYKPNSPENQIAPGIWLLDLPGNTVGFGAGAGLQRTPAATIEAHREDRDGGLALEVGPVSVRPMLYMMTRANTDGGRFGRGVARLMVSVKHRAASARWTRTVIEDRTFQLHPLDDEFRTWDISVSATPRGRQVIDG